MLVITRWGSWVYLHEVSTNCRQVSSEELTGDGSTYTGAFASSWGSYLKSYDKQVAVRRSIISMGLLSLFNFSIDYTHTHTHIYIYIHTYIHTYTQSRPGSRLVAPLPGPRSRLRRDHRRGRRARLLRTSARRVLWEVQGTYHG